MLSKEQALFIAKELIPDLEMRGARISDTFTSGKLSGKLPPDCWYISYSQVLLNYLSCSTGSTIFLCINKEDGKILFHNSIQ